MTESDDEFVTGGALRGVIGVEACQDLGLARVLQAGDRVGPFKLLREIGEGGSSLVFLAERDNGTIRQQVALKVWRDARSARPLALSEGNVLARLNHPQIARVIEAGLSETHGAWLAMAYIDGLAIDHWCRVQGADWRQRLALLMSIAEAVHYAHRQLLAHGDIKPGNVLVDADGQPHLVDFGIAQGLAGSEPSLGCTPGFASPEQLRGEPLHAGSDVFQLGRLAEHLLPTSLPMPGLHRAELRRMLDKAQHPEPEQRYASAEALALDLRRLRTDRASTSLPVSLLSRTRFLWRRRHRALLGLLVLVLLLAVLGWQRQREQQEAALRIAREHTAKNELARLNAGLLVEALRRLGAGADADEFRHFLRGEQARALAEHRLDALIKYEILSGLAPAYVETSDFDEARFVIAEALRLPLPERASDDLGRAYLYCLDALSAALTGKIAEARQVAARSAAIIDQRLASEPEAAFKTQLCLGSVHIQVGEVGASARRVDWSLAFARRHFGVESREYVEAMSQSAEVSRVRMDFGRALDENRYVSARMSRLFGPQSRRARDQFIRLQGTRAAAGEAEAAEAELSRVIAELDGEGQTENYSYHAAHYFRAEARQWLGRYADADHDFQLAIRLLHGKAMDAPTLHRLSDAAIASRLAGDRGQPEIATDAHRAALAFVNANDSDPAFRAQLAVELADALLDAGQADQEVANLLDTAEPLIVQEFGAGSFHAGVVRLNRIRYALAGGDVVRAAMLADSADQTRTSPLQLPLVYPAHRLLASRWQLAIAAIALAQGQLERSEQLAQNALSRSELGFGAQHPLTAGIRVEAARLLSTQRPVWGAAQLALALPVLREQHPANSVDRQFAEQSTRAAAKESR